MQDGCNRGTRRTFQTDYNRNNFGCLTSKASGPHDCRGREPTLSRLHINMRCEERRGEERAGEDGRREERTGQERTGQDRRRDERRGQERRGEVNRWASSSGPYEIGSVKTTGALRRPVPLTELALGCDSLHWYVTMDISDYLSASVCSQTAKRNCSFVCDIKV